jgi:Family of unknown function (DUF6166)
MATYSGKRISQDGGDTVVTIDGQPLENPDPREPRDYEWGYFGTGPQNLARAILTHCLGDKARVERVRSQFRQTVIGCLPREKDWTLTEQDVLAAVSKIEKTLRESGGVD